MIIRSDLHPQFSLIHSSIESLIFNELASKQKIQNKPGNTQGKGTGNVCQLNKDMVLAENLYRGGGVFFWFKIL